MLTIYSDGGSRGNPGPSAFAIVVCKDGGVLHTHSEYIGIGTNNAAEYRGLIYAIGYALDAGADEAEFIMDSELAIKQMNGAYRVKSKDLVKLHSDAKALASAVRNAKFTHARRSDPMIAAADRLLNKKMDAHAKLI
jgi:ribonuclease HI